MAFGVAFFINRGLQFCIRVWVWCQRDDWLKVHLWCHSGGLTLHHPSPACMNERSSLAQSQVSWQLAKRMLIRDVLTFEIASDSHSHQ